MFDEATSDGADRYELLGELGTGGMATVYRGRLRGPRGFARLVAIKCMHPQYAKDAAFVEMFMDEARLSARVRHPSVVSTLDVLSVGGQLLLVMEYVEGESLGQLARYDVSVPAPIACAIVHDVLCGLHAAHEATDEDGSPLGIVHRDVSPQNVMVGTDGVARILDFGVAKAKRRQHHTGEGEIKGKVPYMPPEQLFGDAIDRRVDVYACGVLLWELLTGRRLFDAESDTALVLAVSELEVRAPSAVIATALPAGLDTIVMRALSRDRDERFATALAMASAIERAIGPMASRIEVGAWVQAHCAARIAARNAAAFDPPSLRGPVEAVASALRQATSRRPSLTPVPMTPVPRPVTRLSTLATLVAGAAVVVLTAFTTDQLGRSRPSEMRGAGARLSSVRFPASPAFTVTAPPPTPPPRDVSPLPARSAARTRPEKLGPPPSTSANANSCRPPYAVDDEGRRHYKLECL